MPTFKTWDIVKVPFPYTNRPIQQRRPALVVGIPDTPGAPSCLWVLMITSAANRAWPGDVPVSDLATSGLPAPSVIRPAKIATIESRDAEPLGQLPTPDRPQVTAALHQTLTLALQA